MENTTQNDIGKLLFEKELEGCIRFFWETSARTEKGWGLIPDKFPTSPERCSIASVGFGLPAIIAGGEKGMFDKAQVKAHITKTLDTLLGLENFNGFLRHFYNSSTGEAMPQSEFSTIDSAILFLGVLFAGDFYGGDIQKKAYELYGRANWQFFLDAETNIFHMSYREFRGGFGSKWVNYAEQLMMYFLGMGSPTYPIGKEAYYTFDRRVGSYGGHEFIYSYSNTLFVHQFSHTFIDFKDKLDSLGVNWFDNSAKATYAARQYCIDRKSDSKSYGENSWGRTSCETSQGYKGEIGAPPCDNKVAPDKAHGTIAPCGALGSMIFAPDICTKALIHYYSIPGLSGEYGLKDAFNLDEGWISSNYYGIDKGITASMFLNYENSFIHKIIMNNPFIKKAFDVAGFKLIKKSSHINLG